MTSFRDIPHSATKEGVRLAVPAAVSDSSHVLLCVGVPTETVGNKFLGSWALQKRPFLLAKVQPNKF